MFVQIVLLVCTATGQQNGCSIESKISKHKFPVNVSAQEFIKSWSTSWLSKNKLGLFEYKFPFNKLIPNHKSKMKDVYIIPCKSYNSIILEVPATKPNSETELTKCFNKNSFLKPSGYEKYLEFSFNSHCNDSYMADDVNIVLYWLTSDSKPLIEININHYKEFV